MRKSLIVVLIILNALAGNCQGKAAYILIQPAYLTSAKLNNQFHFNIAAGVVNRSRIGNGISADFYLWDKNMKFVVPKFDFRVFFKSFTENKIPFISLQPGWVIYKKEYAGVVSKGAFAFDALAGYFIYSSSKKIIKGVTISGGYSSADIKVNNFEKTERKSLKLQLGMIL